MRFDSWDSGWHSSRARGARNLFLRVGSCGGPEGYRVKLTCKGCSEKSSVVVGCDSHWFCPACRTRRAQVYRVELQAKLGGLVALASRAGLMSRKRRHQAGGRFGARFLTLTLPHVGSTRQRIETLRRCWPRFWRLLADELRPRLARVKSSGVWIDDKKRGEEWQGEQREANLWELVHYLWALEWTPGSDGLGHPHLHVWLFSPFVDREQIEALWMKAYNDVTGQAVSTLIVDVRKASDDAAGAAAELCKYLVKDWEVDAGAMRPARVEVFAQAFAELDGKRLRQTSAGFSCFSLAVVKACPCCQHTSDGGHWARVELDHTTAERVRLARTLPWSQGPPPVPEPTRRAELGDDDLPDAIRQELLIRRVADLHFEHWTKSPEAGTLARALAEVGLLKGNNGN
ncbi:MAG TPA: hypothetical protein VGC79_15485 [Polyangiaceae bacterium]